MFNNINRCMCVFTIFDVTFMTCSARYMTPMSYSLQFIVFHINVEKKKLCTSSYCDFLSD